MAGTITVELLDLSELAEEYGLDAGHLERFLALAGGAVLEVGGRKGVTDSAWKAAVSEAVRRAVRATPVARSDGSAAGAVAEAGTVWQWGEAERRLLVGNAKVARLFDDFVSLLREQEPHPELQPYSGAVTVIMPGGRQASLRLRQYGLYLFATRKGRRLEERVESPDDFERGLDFLRKPPRYE